MIRQISIYIFAASSNNNNNIINETVNEPGELCCESPERIL